MWWRYLSKSEFKKFKESLEPYISRRDCKKCGGMLVKYEDETPSKYPMGAKISDYMTNFRGLPFLSNSPLGGLLNRKLAKLQLYGRYLRVYEGWIILCTYQRLCT
jgi:hypothetical protein